MLDSVSGGFTYEGLAVMLQWITFGVMILIQAVTAAVIVTRIQAAVQSHVDILKDHEERLRKAEQFIFSHSRHLRADA